MTRRDFLYRAGAAGAGAALASASGPWVPFAGAAVPRVVVVGGGLAGLTAALRLKQAGCAAHIHEASKRLGGRVWTRRAGWEDGQISERGGELIDTGHRHVRRLVRQLGLVLDDLPASETRGTLPLYHFDGQPYTDAQATEDYRAVRRRLRADTVAAGYPTTYRSSTRRGRQLDNMSLAEYIDRAIPGGRSSRFGQLLESAYVGDYGGDAEEQSALNLLYLLGLSSRRFEIYGESDERFHVRGGCDLIIDRLAEELAGQLTLESELVAISRRGNGTNLLTFDQGGATKSVVADRVILALPFSILRSSVDFSRARFSSLKRTAIREQGMATNSKLVVQVSKRHWRTLGNNGDTYADTGYQATWEASRAQRGDAGLLVCWTGGSTGAALTGHPQVLARRFLAQLEPVLPGITARYNGRARLEHWPSHRWTKGSYSYVRVGQYHRFTGVESEIEGTCHFAGEHTSLDFPGWLNGAVESGERAAREVARRTASRLRHE